MIFEAITPSPGSSSSDSLYTPPPAPLDPLETTSEEDPTRILLRVKSTSGLGQGCLTPPSSQSRRVDRGSDLWEESLKFEVKSELSTPPLHQWSLPNLSESDFNSDSPSTYEEYLTPSRKVSEAGSGSPVFNPSVSSESNASPTSIKNYLAKNRFIEELSIDTVDELLMDTKGTGPAPSGSDERNPTWSPILAGQEKGVLSVGSDPSGTLLEDSERESLQTPQPEEGEEPSRLDAIPQVQPPPISIATPLRSQSIPFGADYLPGSSGASSSIRPGVPVPEDLSVSRQHSLIQDQISTLSFHSPGSSSGPISTPAASFGTGVPTTSFPVESSQSTHIGPQSTKPTAGGPTRKRSALREKDADLERLIDRMLEIQSLPLTSAGSTSSTTSQEHQHHHQIQGLSSQPATYSSESYMGEKPSVVVPPTYPTAQLGLETWSSSVGSELPQTLSASAGGGQLIGEPSRMTPHPALLSQATEAISRSTGIVQDSANPPPCKLSADSRTEYKPFDSRGGMGATASHHGALDELGRPIVSLGHSAGGGAFTPVVTGGGLSSLGDNPYYSIISGGASNRSGGGGGRSPKAEDNNDIKSGEGIRGEATGRFDNSFHRDAFKSSITGEEAGALGSPQAGYNRIGGAVNRFSGQSSASYPELHLLQQQQQQHHHPTSHPSQQPQGHTSTSTNPQGRPPVSGKKSDPNMFIFNPGTPWNPPSITYYPPQSVYSAAAAAAAVNNPFLLSARGDQGHHHHPPGGPGTFSVPTHPAMPPSMPQMRKQPTLSAHRDVLRAISNPEMDYAPAMTNIFLNPPPGPAPSLSLPALGPVPGPLGSLMDYANAGSFLGEDTLHSPIGSSASRRSSSVSRRDSQGAHSTTSSHSHETPSPSTAGPVSPQELAARGSLSLFPNFSGPSSSDLLYLTSAAAAAAHRSSFSGGDLKLCAVCGDNASCAHYGVRTCEGCKGFFKRTVQKNAQYVCMQDKNCPVNKRTRNRCQFCRYQKCLSVGMVKEVVRQGSLRGRRGRLPSKTKSQICDEPPSPPVPLVTSLSRAYADSSRRSSSGSSNCGVEPMDTVDQSQSLNQENLIELLHLSYETIRLWAEKVPGFVELSQNDQETLVNFSFFPVLTLRLAHRSADAFYGGDGIRVIFDTGAGYMVSQFPEEWQAWAMNILQESRNLQEHLEMDLPSISCLSALALLQTSNVRLDDPGRVDQMRNTISNALKDHCSNTITRSQHFSKSFALLGELATKANPGVQALRAGNQSAQMALPHNLQSVIRFSTGNYGI